MQLTSSDRAFLNGDGGEGRRLAMELVVGVASANGAGALVDVTQAHIDGCLFHGQAGIDYVSRLAEGGAKVAVPTTLNVSSLDLLHPELYRGDPKTALSARRLMDLHTELGCRPTWTCAPYQLTTRPGFGEQIAWGESNAIVFANSVIGARTNRYGDFIDLACAISGRAPLTGLHTDEGRRATVQIDLDIPDSALDDDLFYPTLGLWVGMMVGNDVPLISGLDDRADEDRLKALGAAGASSGALAMFHALGVTPEATSIAGATGGAEPKHMQVSIADLVAMRRRMGAGAPNLGAVSVGTPHMSAGSLEKLAALTLGSTSLVPFFVNTSRDVVASVDATVLEDLDRFGATVVTDTCTYITPILGDVRGAVMTDSGKWAYYAPANLGVEVVFAGLADCVHSATSGTIVLNDCMAK